VDVQIDFGYGIRWLTTVDVQIDFGYGIRRSFRGRSNHLKAIFSIPTKQMSLMGKIPLNHPTKNLFYTLTSGRVN
jgi:hypothetical protein